MVKHPIQPLESDEHGTLRFKGNAIVCHLLDAGPFGLNDLANMKFDREDWIQFAQLISYSLSGFSELNYVDDDTYAAVEAMRASGKLSSTQARFKAAEATLANLRDGLREPIAALYGLHPDDLKR